MGRTGPSPRVTGDLTAHVQRIDLRAAINKLPEMQRLCVLLFYYVDLPVGQIAQLTERSSGTIKSTLHDARKNLSHLLEADR